MSQEALDIFNRMSEQATTDLAKFSKSFGDDPCHALKWSLSAFEAAAKLEVAKSLIWSFTPRVDWAPVTVAQATKQIENQLLNAARYPAWSTSPTSNLIDQCRLAALTEALDQLRCLERVVK